MSRQQETTGGSNLPVGLRLVIIGGSTAAGLGTRGRSFATIVAESLPDAAILDLSLSGRMLNEHLGFADEIRAFQPDVTLICAGVSESLVHPGPTAQRLIERFAPKSWHGVAGLEPRSFYSSQPTKKARQRLISELKVALKSVIVWLTRGRSRMPPEEFGQHLLALLRLQQELGSRTFVVDLWRTDDRLFPRTNVAFQRTSAQLRAAVRQARYGNLVDIGESLQYWDDFLDDRLHWNASGHGRVAELLLQRIADSYRDEPDSRAPPQPE